MLIQSENVSLILDNMLTAVLVINKSLTINYINQAAEQLFGLGKIRLLGKNLKEIVDYSDFNFDRFKYCIEENQVYTDYEVTFIIQNHRILTEITISPLSIPKNKNNKIILEIRKIEQQRRLDYDVQQHAQHIAARDLIRGLAHEIKNPLGGLRGAAQLLERQFGEDQDIKEYTTVIIEQADRLKNLVDRLLGPQHASPHIMTNIHEILEKIIRLESMEIPLNISIVRDYDPSIPELCMDPEQMQQAVLNIISNAISVLKECKIPNGIIKVKTRVAYMINIHGRIAKTMLHISIIDNGPGIPPDIQDTIFYPMVTRRNGGTGLGLPIAQNIIDQHDGKIECSSWKGHTDFSIYLPIKE